MKLKFCEGVQVKVEDGTYHIEKESTKERFSVSGAGCDFLSMIDGERLLDDIIEELLKMYGGVEPYILVKDMERFTQDLVSSLIIEVCRD